MSSWLKSLGWLILLFSLLMPDALADVHIYGGPHLIDFGSVTPGVPTQPKTLALCIYRDGGGNRYDITATSDTVGGRFVLRNAANQPLAYSAEWQGTVGDYFTLVDEATYSNISRARTINYCNNGNKNANLRITFADVDIAAAHAGTYNGTLTIILAPA